MSKTTVTYMSKDEDTGIVYEFGFMIDGKKYKVTAKSGNQDKMDEFYRFVKKAEKTGLNPFVYRSKQFFDIERDNPTESKKPTPPVSPRSDSEQMDLFGKAASYLDKIANVLEEKGFTDVAYQVDEISNALESSKWCGVDSMGFWDEVANMDIGYETAKKVLDAFDSGADTEHSCAQVSKVDAWTCKRVLDLAESLGLLTVLNDGHYEEWLEKFGPASAKKRVKEVYKKLQKKA